MVNVDTSGNHTHILDHAEALAYFNGEAPAPRPKDGPVESVLRGKPCYQRISIAQAATPDVYGSLRLPCFRFRIVPEMGPRGR